MLKSRAAERSAPDESVEAVRRRARYRLVGALVLVALGVVGFPLVFDTQPRPMDTDLAIVIPDKNQVAPLTVAPQVATPNAAADAQAAAKPEAAPPTPEPQREAKAETPEETKPEVKSEAKPEPKPAPKIEAKPAPKPEPKLVANPETPRQAVSSKDESARARAILEGKASAVKADGQWVVQVGAYGDDASVQRVRRMLEAGGLKTFTQALAVSGGTVTRVRLGPYASTADAELAQAKAKSLGFTAAKVLKP